MIAGRFPADESYWFRLHLSDHENASYRHLCYSPAACAFWMTFYCGYGICARHATHVTHANDVSACKSAITARHAKSAPLEFEMPPPWYLWQELSDFVTHYWRESATNEDASDGQAKIKLAFASIMLRISFAHLYYFDWGAYASFRYF